MRGARLIFEEIVRIATAVLTVSALLSLMFSVASFFANRRPLTVEADIFSFRGIRMGAQISRSFQSHLIDATKVIDVKARDALIREWSRVANALQADTSVLVLHLSNRSTRPLSNVNITIDSVSQFNDMAIDTNARAVLDAVSKGTLATYLPTDRRLEIQSFPRLPAKTQVTISVWGKFDLAPDLSTMIVTDELGVTRVALAKRVTGFRAKILENAQWLTIALGLFILYEALSLVDRLTGRQTDSTI